MSESTLASGRQTVDAPSPRRTVCVDFDGVLHSYTSGWVAADVVPDPPVDGAIDWLRGLEEAYDVVVLTTRAREPGGAEAVLRWLAANGYDGDAVVTDRKVPALLYIDGRAWVFRGRFPDVDRIATMYPWQAGMPVQPPVREKMRRLREKVAELKATVAKVEARQARLKHEFRAERETAEEMHSALHAALGDVPRCQFCEVEEET